MVVLKKIFGVGCVLVGIVGLVLPIIPGVLLLLLGMSLLAGPVATQKLRAMLKR